MTEVKSENIEEVKKPFISIEVQEAINQMREQKGDLFGIEEVTGGSIIPKPFFNKNGSLFRIQEKKKEGVVVETLEIFVCRNFPVITRKLSNVERSEVFYEVYWRSDQREFREVVPAIGISTKSELLKLADKNLAVTDRNAKDLIFYFERYIAENHIPYHHAVDRMGHIKTAFIHPLMSDNVEIMPPDIGEKQTLEAFQSQGTQEEWLRNVLYKVKDRPKVLAILLSSFTSVILKDLRLSPFIVDLSGVTSRGKTTALHVAASVWGTSHLINEWNATKVSIERKSAFLNSFPAFYDDSMKAQEYQLQQIVYNYSGGRSKGRGSIKGSQMEYTWNNLLISTGENSLVEYARQAGGAAARILPLTGLPFEGVDHKFFNELYQSVDKYHGRIGIDFLEQWKEKKADYIGLYAQYNDQFQKLSAGNDVLGRIARHYAAIVFTAHLLKEFFQASINIQLLVDLFEDVKLENKSTDKPKQLLEQILSDLDSDRGSIYYNYYPERREIKAIYHKDTLYIQPSYLSEMLGADMWTIRKEWMRRGMTSIFQHNGSEVDYKQIRHNGDRFKVVAFNSHTLQELGFNFERDPVDIKGL
ncbi:DUF927 domain-containing protein [Planococcus beigongshangi]|uniref:DUF927 domain-containing protein n=1 Tax=Planococcus beigongshangi TaxID=2782536 RepID=UPI001EEE98B0|nr:DUF927 domain-containing protein [Planococcus beigongshangi]